MLAYWEWSTTYRCIANFGFIYMATSVRAFDEKQRKNKPKIHTHCVYLNLWHPEYHAHNCAFLCLSFFRFRFSLFLLLSLPLPAMVLMVFHTFNQFKFILNSQLTEQYNFHWYRSNEKCFRSSVDRPCGRHVIYDNE